MRIFALWFAFLCVASAGAGMNPPSSTPPSAKSCAALLAVHEGHFARLREAFESWLSIQIDLPSGEEEITLAQWVHDLRSYPTLHPEQQEALRKRLARAFRTLKADSADTFEGLAQLRVQGAQEVIRANEASLAAHLESATAKEAEAAAADPGAAPAGWAAWKWGAGAAYQRKVDHHQQLVAEAAQLRAFANAANKESQETAALLARGERMRQLFTALKRVLRTDAFPVPEAPAQLTSAHRRAYLQVLFLTVAVRLPQQQTEAAENLALSIFAVPQSLQALEEGRLDFATAPPAIRLAFGSPSSGTVQFLRASLLVRRMNILPSQWLRRVQSLLGNSTNPTDTDNIIDFIRQVNDIWPLAGFEALLAEHQHYAAAGDNRGKDYQQIAPVLRVLATPVPRLTEDQGRPLMRLFILCWVLAQERRDLEKARRIAFLWANATPEALRQVLDRDTGTKDTWMARSLQLLETLR